MAEETFSTIKNLFDLLDSYLIGDLKTMVFEVPARPSGGLGFPSMQTILSGMELLGRLLSGGKEDERAFNYFWDNFFVKDSPQYDSTRLQKIFRCSVRNGTAHYFLVKFGIRITKEDAGNLTRTQNNELNVDVITLYKDFEKTYSRVKKELLESVPADEVVAKFQEGYRRLLEDLSAARTDVDEYIKGISETPQMRGAGDSGIGPIGYKSDAPATKLPDDMLSKGDVEQPPTTSSGYDSDDSVIRLPRKG